MSAQVDPALVALLAEHEERQHLIDGRWMLICLCREWAPDFEFDDRAEEQHDLFRAHLAAVVSEYVEAREREAGVRNAVSALRGFAHFLEDSGLAAIGALARERADLVDPITQEDDRG